MLEFITIYILIGVVYFIGKKFNLESGLKSLLILLPIGLASTSIVGLRPLSAGFDTEIYVGYFSSLRNETVYSFNEVYAYNFQSDYLYRLWNYIIYSFNEDANFFIYISSLISILLFLLSLRKLFKESYLLIFLLFFATPGFVMMFGNAIRQGFAIPFFLFSIHFFLEHKKVYTLLAVLATLLFHQGTGLILVITIIGVKVIPQIIEKHKVIFLLFLLLLQPLVLTFSESLYSFFPTKYFLVEGYEYFFHYSFIVFLILFYLYSIEYKIKSENAKRLFYVYCTLTLISSLIWFNPAAYGRILYLGYPLLFYFLTYFNNVFKGEWVNYSLIIIMFFVGIYFYSFESVHETLTWNSLEGGRLFKQNIKWDKIVSYVIRPLGGKV